jgi:uncharacterized membrane protein YcaP (DUF421 family)
MLVVCIRALILYGLVLVSIRIMGKREIGKLQPYEFVIALMLADLASTPMGSTGIPMFTGVLPIMVILIIQLLLSWITLKSPKARKLICGNPVVVISHGKILETQMRELRMSFSDLISQLRINGIYSLSDVEYAILETSGGLSVLPKAEQQAVTPSVMHLPVAPVKMPITVILDGDIQWDHFANTEYDLDWLKKELGKHGFRRAADVLYACIESDGSLFIQGKMGVKPQEAQS